LFAAAMPASVIFQVPPGTILYPTFGNERQR
jgi:hypothetical protein